MEKNDRFEAKNGKNDVMQDIFSDNFDKSGDATELLPDKNHMSHFLEIRTVHLLKLLELLEMKSRQLIGNV